MPPGTKDWDRAWREGHTPWDLRGVTPPLQALAETGFFDRLGLRAKAPIAVPGCGRGHDVRLLAELGHDVVGFDVVPRAVAEARALLEMNRVEARVLCRDVLGLWPEFADAFQMVYEYTCFCALPPHLRPSYARVMGQILEPGGFLLGLMFPMRAECAGRDEGLPYLVTEADVRASFGEHLQLIESFAPEHSAPGRADAERWFLWRRQASAKESAMLGATSEAAVDT